MLKRIGMALGALALCASLAGCFPNKVEPGEVGVIVSTMGSDKGVDMKPPKSSWGYQPLYAAGVKPLCLADA